MNARTGALLLVAAALPLLGLAGVSWVAPLAGLWLLGVSVWLLRRPAPAAASWAVVGGALTALLGLGFVVFGAFAAGLLTLALGSAAGFVGAELSLATHPRTRPLPGPRSARTHVAVAADEAMKWYWHASGLVSPQHPALWLEALHAAAERNRAAGVLEDPRRAHATPPALEKHGLRRVELAGLPAAEEIRFDSEFEPRDPEVRDDYLAVAQNREARALLWRHRSGVRPTLILIHGYGMGRAALDARAFELPRLHHGLGLDVALVTLPLHGPRAPGRRSGAGFLDGHPLATNAAFEQAIFELRRLAGWLRAQGTPRLGVYGMSLGGYTAALFASLERGLACAVPLVPAVSLPALLSAARSPEQRQQRESLGLTDALLAEAWASHDPLRHRPRVAPEGRLILAGLSDRICTPDQVDALWQHWERPSIHWFAGSHLAHFGRRARQERLEVHLRGTLLDAQAERLSRFRGVVQTG